MDLTELVPPLGEHPGPEVGVGPAGAVVVPPGVVAVVVVAVVAAPTSGTATTPSTTTTDQDRGADGARTRVITRRVATTGAVVDLSTDPADLRERTTTILHPQPLPPNISLLSTS